MAAEHLDRRVHDTRVHTAALDADALLVTHLSNITWLTGFAGSSAAVLLIPDRLYLLTDSRYEAATARLKDAGHLPAGTEIVIAERPLDEAAAAILTSVGAETIAIEAEHLAVRRFTRFQGLLPKGSHLLPAEPFLERLRAVKDTLEVSIYREAATRLAEVCALVPGTLAIGRAERDIAADIDFQLKRHGFERPAFDTIVASGPNSALPHARPTERVLTDGDPIVLDFGGVYAGYCVDLTRTAVIGQPTKTFLGLFQAVEEAQAAAIAAVRDGAHAGEVDAAARMKLGAHGLEAAIAHATGHGLGIEVHEYPRIGRPGPDGEDPVLRTGMIVTIEPGVYVRDVGGVRIEDDVLVLPTGGDVLTDIPRGLMTPGAR